MTCHAAIVARELGVPCVVGTRTATRDLHDGTTVTVVGTHGRVLSAVVEEAEPTVSAAERIGPAEPMAETTATRIYVNMAMPESAETVAAQPVDGVGLLRAEFMLTEALSGRHPRDLIAHGEQDNLSTRWSLRSDASRSHSHPGPSCIGQQTSAATSFAACAAARPTSRSSTIR
jgi:pyruvate, water dikinase